MQVRHYNHTKLATNFTAVRASSDFVSVALCVAVVGVVLTGALIIGAYVVVLDVTITGAVELF